MSNFAKHNIKGFICPVRGCDKKDNSRFTSLGMAMHLIKKHKGEFEKRLKLKTERR